MAATPRSRLAATTAAVALVGSAALSACGSDSDVVPSATHRPLSTSCAKVHCQGSIDGAAYQVELPSGTWNGTLLLYSHGYRQAGLDPVSKAQPNRKAQDAPDPATASALLAKGYALAGSAYASNGWATQDGVKADEALYAWFRDNVGRPLRVYAWGDSLGGLITEMLAEKHPDWVVGAAPLCGVLAGTNNNLDLALDVAYGVKTLLDPSLQLTGYASYDDAVAAFRHAFDAVYHATTDTTNGIPKILALAALVDAPKQTATYDGHDLPSLIGSYVEAIATALGYGTYDRWEIEQRVGGNPSTNVGVDYRKRFDANERSLLDTFGTGKADQLIGALQDGQRVSADPAARTKADALGNPTGRIERPTITLHTEADPLVIVPNEAVFLQRVNRAKDRTGDLLQLFTQAPHEFTAPAPYGAGHCNFTTQENVAVISLLDLWVRGAQYPATAQVRAAFAGDKGYDPDYVAPAWPVDLDR
ncbi:MAG: hypothetical protein ACJ74O_14950 [Frankiaceae bacterium]